MSSGFQPPEELVRLVLSAIDGQLSEDDHNRLEALTRSDPDARQFYVEFVQLHSVLQRRAYDLFVDGPIETASSPSLHVGEESDASRALASVGVSQSKTITGKTKTMLGRRPLAVAACVGGLLAVGVTLFGPAGDDQADVSINESVGYVGVVRESEGVVLESGQLPPAVGDFMPDSLTKVTRGSLVLETFSGALLTLNAPCEVDFVAGQELLDCRSGRLAIEVINPECKLTVRTPVGELLHIGTEYQIAVDQATGETKLEVYDGGVRLRSESLAAAPGSARVFSPGAAVSMRPTGEIAKLNRTMEPLPQSRGLLPARPVPYISPEGYTVRMVLAPGDNYHPPDPGDTDAARIPTLASAEKVFADGLERGDVFESRGIRRIDFQDGYAKPQYAEMLASYVNLFNVDARPPPFEVGSEPSNCFVMRIGAELIVDRSWEYSFIVCADDGCRLRIDGADVIVDDGVHPPQLSVGAVALDAGTHKLEILAYDDHGFHRLELGVASGRTLRTERFTLLECREPPSATSD